MKPRVQVKVSLDQGSYLQLVERARREGRSLSNLAGWLLEGALGNCKAGSAQPPVSVLEQRAAKEQDDYNVDLRYEPLP